MSGVYDRGGMVKSESFDPRVTAELEEWHDQSERKSPGPLVSVFPDYVPGTVDTQDWSEVPQVKEVREILDGNWNGVPHWAVEE